MLVHIRRALANLSLPISTSPHFVQSHNISQLGVAVSLIANSWEKAALLCGYINIKRSQNNICNDNNRLRKYIKKNSFRLYTTCYIFYFIYKLTQNQWHGAALH